MSTTDNTTQQDKPEYIRGDVIEVFDPESKAFKWIEVEEVIEIHSTQGLAFRGCYFCACWVRVESIGAPGMVESSEDRKEVDGEYVHSTRVHDLRSFVEKPDLLDSTGWLIAELDKLTSIIVRKRDMREASGLQSSHFYSRRYLAIRFDLRIVMRFAEALTQHPLREMINEADQIFLRQEWKGLLFGDDAFLTFDFKASFAL